ncbi:MAG: hypothetical protein AB7Q00_02200 [Phycisphaerales bacterium]
MDVHPYANRQERFDREAVEVIAASAARQGALPVESVPFEGFMYYKGVALRSERVIVMAQRDCRNSLINVCVRAAECESLSSDSVLWDDAARMILNVRGEDVPGGIFWGGDEGGSGVDSIKAALHLLGRVVPRYWHATDAQIRDVLAERLR